MLGAIIGDIVGSVYEWNNIKTKDFPLFSDRCYFTDDTVMTIAIADAIMQSEDFMRGRKVDSFGSIYDTPDIFIDSMKKWGRLYPDSCYGGRFGSWLFSDSREPYNSWGNGSAMRVSPCGWVVGIQMFIREGFGDVLYLAKKSAEVTHNHPEGIKGAQATAMAIYFARHGKVREDINVHKDFIRDCLGVGGKVDETRFDYDLNRTLDEIRPGYQFSETCQETVPEAIIAFLESIDFEDAIRNAISLGGDSGTLAAITGSIAEAAYGVPNWIRDKALSYLDKPLLEVYERWSKWCGRNEAKNISVNGEEI